MGCFWGWGYYLAPSKDVFIHDHAWLYQLVWFPSHILLAYASIVVYKKAAYGLSHFDVSIKSLWGDLRLNYRTSILSMLLITPFMVQDLIEGMVELHRDYQTLGDATWIMIGPIWMTEWLMIAVMWSRVLATIRLTLTFYTHDYVKSHLDDLLIVHSTSPILQAGVENALINLIYGLTTIGYIQFAGGELSDYQNVVILAVLVLACFLSTFIYMRKRISDALESIVLEHVKKIQTVYGSIEPTKLQDAFVKQRLNIDLLNQFVFDKSLGLSKRPFERMAIVRAGLLIQSIEQSGQADTLQVQQSLETMRYTQYELKLANLGIEELQGVLIRLGSPAVMYFAKSSDILSKFTN